MRVVSYGRFIESLAFCERMLSTLFVALFLHCGFICVVLVERVEKWACVLMCSCLEFLRATCYKCLILFVEFLFHILLHVRTKFPSSELCLVGVSFMYLLLLGFILIACLCSGRSIGVKNSRMLQHNLQNKNVLPANYCCENLLCLKLVLF